MRLVRHRDGACMRLGHEVAADGLGALRREAAFDVLEHVRGEREGFLGVLRAQAIWVEQAERHYRKENRKRHAGNRATAPALRRRQGGTGGTRPGRARRQRPSSIRRKAGRCGRRAGNASSSRLLEHLREALIAPQAVHDSRPEALESQVHIVMLLGIALRSRAAVPPDAPIRPMLPREDSAHERGLAHAVFDLRRDPRTGDRA